MNIQAYLDAVPQQRRERLIILIDAIATLYPSAEATMKYKMPTYSNETGWVAIANQKNYISLYTCHSDYLTEFRQQYPNIKTGKGCINFRDKEDIPLDAVKTVIRLAMESTHST